MTALQQYSPKCSVVFSTRRSGRIDTTADLLLRLNTHRGINTPTGTWDVQLTGKRVDGRSTLADLIDPMDYVEIRVARVPSQGGGMPIIMRGFVDNARAINDGHTRTVSVNGRDYGKLLSQFQVYYLTEMDPASALNPQARLEINFGIPVGVVTPSQFVNLIFQNIVYPNLKPMQTLPGVGGYVPRVTVPDRFSVNGFTVQPFTGAVYNLLSQYADQPWVETFTSDTPAGAVFYYRWAPLEGPGGSPLAGWAETPATHQLEDRDVSHHDVGRSDNEAVSYYFTYPNNQLLDRAAFKGEGIDLKRGNPYMDTQALERYGYRPMEVATRLIPSLAGLEPDGKAAAQPSVIDLAVELNQWLIKANQDNPRLLNGTLNVKGGGGIQAGEYVQFDGRRYYVASTATSFDAQHGRCTGSLNVTRGQDR